MASCHAQALRGGHITQLRHLTRPRSHVAQTIDSVRVQPQEAQHSPCYLSKHALVGGTLFLLRGIAQLFAACELCADARVPWLRLCRRRQIRQRRLPLLHI